MESSEKRVPAFPSSSVSPVPRKIQKTAHKHPKDVPISRPTVKKCVYDSFFAMDNTATEAIEKAFESAKAYELRIYGQYYNKKDLEYLENLAKKGGPILKLMFVIGELTHDAAWRAQVEECSDPAVQEKVRGFFRVMSIAMRSMYEANIDEHTAKRIVLSTVEYLHRCWSCCDKKHQDIACDYFASRGFVRQSAEEEEDARKTAEMITSEAIGRERMKMARRGKRGRKR